MARDLKCRMHGYVSGNQCSQPPKSSNAFSDNFLIPSSTSRSLRCCALDSHRKSGKVVKLGWFMAWFYQHLSVSKPIFTKYTYIYIYILYISIAISRFREFTVYFQHYGITWILYTYSILCALEAWRQESDVATVLKGVSSASLEAISELAKSWIWFECFLEIL